MQTKGLATILTAGALSVLVLTFGTVQDAYAGGHYGARVTNAGPPRSGHWSLEWKPCPRVPRGWGPSARERGRRR